MQKFWEKVVLQSEMNRLTQQTVVDTQGAIEAVKRPHLMMRIQELKLEKIVF